MTADDIEIGGDEVEVVRSGPQRRILAPPAGVQWHGGEPKNAGPLIVISIDAAKAIDRHSRSTLRQELGGLLLGEAGFTRTGQPIAVVRAAVPVESSDASGTHFRFQGPGQKAAYDRIDREYAGVQIVGWYHTHPRMSVFMSGTDIQSHSSLFRTPWHIAMVLEPASNEAGFFGWFGDRVLPVPEYGYFQDPEPLPWTRRREVPLVPAPVPERGHDEQESLLPTARESQVLPAPSVPFGRVKGNRGGSRVWLAAVGALAVAAAAGALLLTLSHEKKTAEATPGTGIPAHAQTAVPGIPTITPTPATTPISTRLLNPELTIPFKRCPSVKEATFHTTTDRQNYLNEHGYAELQPWQGDRKDSNNVIRWWLGEERGQNAMIALVASDPLVLQIITWPKQNQLQSSDDLSVLQEILGFINICRKSSP